MRIEPKSVAFAVRQGIVGFYLFFCLACSYLNDHYIQDTKVISNVMETVQSDYIVAVDWGNFLAGGLLAMVSYLGDDRWQVELTQNDLRLTGQNISFELSLASPDLKQHFLSLYQQIKKEIPSEQEQDFLYATLKGMINTLDVYSAFLTPEEFFEFQINAQGSFVGIGIELRTDESGVFVSSVMDRSPAWEAGILPNDQIIGVDGITVSQKNKNDLLRKIRGAKGTAVSLTIQRTGVTQPISVQVVRKRIQIKSVEFQMLEADIGYLKILQFQYDTPHDFDLALKAFQSMEHRGLILDLRDNPGGLLSQAIEIADRFIREGVIVSTRGRSLDQSSEVFARQEGTLPDFPLLVLVNHESVSSAEIVAGCLFDHNRALLIGEQTFGKGSIQTVFPLEDGSGLRLTTAYYDTPAGTSIDARGITPDILVKEHSGTEDSILKTALAHLKSNFRDAN